MKKIIFLIMTIVCFNLTKAFPQYFPQNSDKFQAAILEKIRMVNVDLNLNFSNSFIAQKFNSDLMPIDNQLRIYIKLNYSGSDIIDSLNTKGCEIINYTANECYLWIPFEQIEEIASLENVYSVWNKGKVITRSVIGEGYSFLKGDKAKDLFYATGQGVKVGVISDGMEYSSASQINGDLPPYITSVANSSNPDLFPGSEGTAMMEIIYDFTPNASLYFGGINQTNNPLDMANRISALDQAGCKIIVDDLGWLSGIPYFQEWEISTAINQFVNNKGIYITAAGNDREVMYGGNNYSYNNKNCILWKGSDSLLEISCSSESQIDVVLQWANEWMWSSDNFDLYLYDKDYNLIGSAETNNSGNGKHPEEIVGFSFNPTYTGKLYVKAVLKNNLIPTPAKPEIKLQVIGDKSKLTNPSAEKQIYGHQITQKVLSVGATSAFPYPNKGMEYFSSIGPAIQYTQAGPLHVKQPIITAADSNQTYVGQQGNFGNPFTGTSAAAPHVAAIAALFCDIYKNKTPVVTSDDFIKACTTGATPFANGSSQVWNKASGYGLINAYNTLLYGLSEVSGANISTNQSLIYKRLKGNTTVSSNVTLTIPAGTTSSIAGTLTLGTNTKIEIYGTLILEPGTKLDYQKLIEIAGGKIWDESGMAVDVTIDQKDNNNNSFGNISYLKNFWTDKSVPFSLKLSKTTSQYFRADTNYKTGTNEKFYNWNEKQTKVVNYDTFYIDANINKITAYFKPTAIASISNQSPEVTNQLGGFVKFNDPWLRDFIDDYGIKNRGINSIFKDNQSPFVISSLSNYKGVFLNQEIASNKPYYKVKAISPQTINTGGRDRKFYFQNWSAEPATSADFNAPDSLETAVVFKNENAVVSANYKGSMLSNNANAFANKGQRKVVRTENGYLHLVYESMNRVWYERSTNNGNTWEEPKRIYNNGYNKQRNCAIDYYLNTIYLLYEDYYENNNNIPGELRLITINVNKEVTSNEHVNDIDWTTSTTPVISANYNYIFIIWREEDTSTLKITIKHKEPNDTSWKCVEKKDLPFAGINSFNPAISTYKVPENILPQVCVVPVNWRPIFDVVWEEKLSNIVSEIKYIRLKTKYSVENELESICEISDIQKISEGSSFSKNVKPSITSIPDPNNPNSLVDANAYISWIGERCFDELPDKPYPCEKKAIFTSTALAVRGQLYNLGNDVSNVNINKCDTRWTVAWGRSNDLPIQYFDSRSLDRIYQLNQTGKDVQISNGKYPSDMYYTVYNSKTLPYSITTKQLYPSTIPIEITTIQSREGIVSEGNGGIYYNIGDIIINGESVRFSEIPDTAYINSIEGANNYLVSDAFTVNDNTEFYYTIRFGITDSALVSQALGVNDNINFKVELIDANSYEVIGMYDSISYNQSNYMNYDNVSYQVNTNGIGEREVRLRLVISSNTDSYYSIADVLTDGTMTLSKKSYREINYKGEVKKNTEIKEYNYSLSQNYPNPFNPSTEIKYSIKEKGLVTIKIYDILGNVVKTLLEENKEAGNYSVTFNASNFSSGIYFYELTVMNGSQPFRSTKKMIILK